MGVSKAKSAVDTRGLTERQQKWFASVEASMERDTGKTLAQWVKIAKTCPETTPKKRSAWLREKYGIGANRGAHILHAAFPPEGPSWDDPEALLDALWEDRNGRKIYDAVAKLVRKEFPDAIIGPRKTFVSFARKIQWAGILPATGGKAELGLPLPVSTSKRLSPMKKRPWAEKHTAILVLSSPKEVDAEVKRLLKLAWEKGA
jgi:Domain of unknown function (DUF4287)/Domain of unknown function (DUF5655)